jgi:hypothetical protein
MRIWRVASALKWAFADFDDLSVDADTQWMMPMPPVFDAPYQTDGTLLA